MDLKSSLLGALLVALAAASAHSAEPAPLRDPIFQNQRGSGSPGGPGPYYPERAHRLGITGTALIECTLTAKGRLNDCRAIEEQPRGQNFIDAAMLMAKRGWMKAKPAELDGKPVDGEIVRVLVPFNAGRRPNQ